MNTRMRFILTVAMLGTASPHAHAGNFSVIGELTRECALTRGDVKQESIVVRNPGQAPVQIRAYQRDYRTYADGRKEFGKPGSVDRSNSGWITVTPHEMVLEPGQTASFKATVRVPENASLSGTYWSVVMVEPVPDMSLLPPLPKTDKPTVRVVAIKRYAIQFVTHLGKSGTYQLRFAEPRIEDDDGERMLALDIENTGSRWIRPNLWAEVYDESGVSRGRFSGKRLRLFPGCSVRSGIDISTLPTGRYQALIVADGGADDNVFGGRYQLDVK